MGDAGNSHGCKRRSHHSSAMDHGILLIAADQSRRRGGDGGSGELGSERNLIGLRDSCYHHRHLHCAGAQTQRWPFQRQRPRDQCQRGDPPPGFGGCLS